MTDLPINLHQGWLSVGSHQTRLINNPSWMLVSSYIKPPAFPGEATQLGEVSGFWRKEAVFLSAVADVKSPLLGLISLTHAHTDNSDM